MMVLLFKKATKKNVEMVKNWTVPNAQEAAAEVVSEDEERTLAFEAFDNL